MPLRCVLIGLFRVAGMMVSLLRYVDSQRIEKYFLLIQLAYGFLFITQSHCLVLWMWLYLQKCGAVLTAWFPLPQVWFQNRRAKERRLKSESPQSES